MTLDEFENENILIDKLEECFELLVEAARNPMCDDELKKIIAKFGIDAMGYCLKKAGA